MSKYSRKREYDIRDDATPEASSARAAAAMGKAATPAANALRRMGRKTWKTGYVHECCLRCCYRAICAEQAFSVLMGMILPLKKVTLATVSGLLTLQGQHISLA